MQAVVLSRTVMICDLRVVCRVLQISDLNLAVEGLEKERDFYFSKLRDVEVLCQEHENDNIPIVTQILDILYATEVRTTSQLYCFLALWRGVINIFLIMLTMHFSIFCH